MQYTCSTAKDGNLYPAAFDALHAIPDQMLHQQEHDALRHPLATYNLSIHRVVEAFRAVLDQLKQLDAAETTDSGTFQFDPEPLLTAQKELLDSLAAHIDDGYQILRALYPAAQLKRDVRFADRWLEEAGHGKVMRPYKDAVTPYRQTFIPIVNHIKHATGRLRACVFYDDRQRIGGYILETADRKGVVGPDPTIHPGNTAFSLNRDLRYHFCHLYDVGEALKQALVRAAERDYKIALVVAPVAAPDVNWEQIAERIGNLPLWFFPDEALKSTPVVLFTRSGSDSILSVEETRAVVPFVPRTMHVRATWKGDGVTRTWRVPYMQHALH